MSDIRRIEQAFAREEVPEFAVGDTVEHDHFGLGRVQLLAGAGPNARATVLFEHHGSKQLLLQYARLSVVTRGGGA